MHMTPYRASLYRIILWAAAVYNVSFGLWAGVRPLSFFHVFAIDEPRYPAIWSCLGMVVGVYGLGYAYAAVRLDRAKPFVLIGLIGKILGPAGWIVTVAGGEWPVRTFALIAFNDLLWWLPFSLFLLEGTRLGERVRGWAARACGILHVLSAAVMLVVLRPGMEVVRSPEDRVAYITAHPVWWRLGWVLWMAAAASLIAFYGWWGSRLRRPSRGIPAFVIGSIGLCFDFAAEALYLGWLPAGLERVTWLGAMLSGGVANTLYCVAGVILTVHTRNLRVWPRLWTWAIWGSGLVLTWGTLTQQVPVMVAAIAVLMTLLCPWLFVVGRTVR